MVYLDADGCPVVKAAVEIAQSYGYPITIVCDVAHEFHEPYAQLIQVSQGADSADYAIVNRVHPGDLVVTQDYGLATLVLSRCGEAMDQNGRMYTNHNIDGLLDMRYLSGKARRAGGHIKGPKARRAEQNTAFVERFTQWMESRPAGEK